jgi:hypothetical protein
MSDRPSRVACASAAGWLDAAARRSWRRYVRNIRARPAEAGSPDVGPVVSPSSSSFWPSSYGGSCSPLRRTCRMRRSARRLALTRGRWSADHSSPLVGNGSGSRCSCGVSFCARTVSWAGFDLGSAAGRLVATDPRDLRRVRSCPNPGAHQGPYGRESAAQSLPGRVRACRLEGQRTRGYRRLLVVFDAATVTRPY